MQARPPDVRALAEALTREGLRYVLVGGMALVLLGGSYVTYDCDLAVAFEQENVRKIVRALAPFNPRLQRLAPGAPWVWNEFSIRPPWTILETDLGRVDLLVRLPGVDSFDGLYSRSSEHAFEGTSIRIASVDDLIAMKAVSERPKDQLHLMELRALKRLIEEEGQSLG